MPDINDRNATTAIVQRDTMDLRPAAIQTQQQGETAAILSLVERAASNPSVDLDKMERLLQMHKDMLADQAKAAFNKAMKDAQAEMRPISTDMLNPQTKSKYASYAKLDRALRPIYTKHGFSISFDEADSPKANHVRVIAYVAHDGGHERIYRRDMPADGKGAKGGDVMTLTHATGAAHSYGARYLLKGIFNVAVGEEDRDGNEPRGGGAITEEQADRLLEMLDEGQADKRAFCKYFGIDGVPELPAKRWTEAKQMAEIKVRAAKQRAARAAQAEDA